MAYIYSQEGRWDKAIAEYRKLLNLDPNDFNVHNMLGDVYVKKTEFQEAFASYILCSDAYIKMGQTEKATVVYRKLSRLDPSKLEPCDYYPCDEALPFDGCRLNAGHMGVCRPRPEMVSENFCDDR